MGQSSLEFLRLSGRISPDIINMPLYNLSCPQYLGFVRFFNASQNENKLGKRELSAILSKYNITATDNELQLMIDSISIDSNGIGLQAFMDYVSTWSSLRDQDQEFAEAFRIYDRSGSGSLNGSDIRYVLNKLGTGISEADVTALIEEADSNRDGVIQYDEFVKLMKRKF